MPEEFEVAKEVELDATPEQVWEAIATGPGLAAWFMPMEMDPDSDLLTTWEPGTRLAVRTPPTENGSTQAFEYLIEAREGGSTVLRFVHSFHGEDWNEEFVGMTSSGWDMYLHTLAEYFVHFPGRSARYVEAEAPASSGRPEAWARLLEAVLPAAGPELGARVRLTLPGTEPVDGVVDYVSEHFLGVRTDAALIRFHERSRIGMPVAVSHHAYAAGSATEEIDTAAWERAWASWLAEAIG